MELLAAVGVLVVFVVLWIVAIAADLDVADMAGDMAAEQGRSRRRWYWLSLAFGNLALSALRESGPDRVVDTPRRLVVCPTCQATVASGPTCRSCGNRLSPLAPRAARPAPPASADVESDWRWRDSSSTGAAVATAEPAAIESAAAETVEQERPGEAPTAAGTYVTIRNAEIGDAVAIAALAGQLGYPSDPADVRERLAALPPDDEVLLALANGEVAGWIHLTTVRTLVDAPSAGVYGLVVGEAWRRHGIGRRLLEWADDYARRHGLGRVSLRSNVIREDAHAFYRAEGFDEVKRQIAFRRSVEP